MVTRLTTVLRTQCVSLLQQHDPLLITVQCTVISLKRFVFSKFRLCYQVVYSYLTGALRYYDLSLKDDSSEVFYCTVLLKYCSLMYRVQFSSIQLSSEYSGCDTAPAIYSFSTSTQRCKQVYSAVTFTNHTNKFAA